MPTTYEFIGLHTAEQTESAVAGVVQVQPFSIAEQVEVHPSELARLLSSQTSLPYLIPSPQIGEQTLGEAELQFHPVSTMHVEEHPSPGRILLSSQASGPSTVPFPQVVVQTEKLPLLGLVHYQPAST